MTVLFIQQWDIATNKNNEYSDYIMTRYAPKMQELGLKLLGGYYVAVGEGPRIIAASLAQSMEQLQKALDNDTYQTLNSEILNYVTRYRSRILVPTGRVRMEGYKIERGVWKFTQGWSIVPGAEAKYSEFVQEEYLPTMEKIGLKVVGGWRVVVGSGPNIISESSAPGIVPIATALDTDDFRRIMRKLKTSYVTGYHSRILSPTGRIEIPFFMSEMMKGL